jgi:signal transduction histidine kinase
MGVSTFLLYHQIQWVEEIRNHSNKLEVLTLNLIKNDNDFFDYEATNEEYFKNHRSRFIVARDSLLLRIRSRSGQMKRIVSSKNTELAIKLRLVDSLILLYNLKFNRLENRFYARGFKDYGIEGAMRDHAHALEAAAEDILRSNVLMLRRVEKDFLLRHDTAYVKQFNDLIEKQINSLQRDSLRKHQSLFHVRKYRDEFNSRVKVEKEIGLSSHLGLRAALNSITTQLGNHFGGMSAYTETIYRSILRSAVFVYSAVLLIAIIISVVSSFWISNKLAAPIVRLTRWVDDTTNQTSEVREEEMTGNGSEISSLTQSFVNLIKRTRKQMTEIEEKSKLLDKQNQVLIKLNHELDNFLYSTAHDLRSPLSSLTGLVKLMKLENEQPALQPYLEMMDSNIRRQENFISQIVGYAKNGKLDIVPEKINLKETILAIFNDHEFIEGSFGIQKYISVKQESAFYSDKNRVSIILNNLISNAIRYADAEKGDDRFIAIKIEIDHACVMINFSDNGVGIEAEYLDKIFNMFYRANVNSKGSGLGLFILKEAVSRLKGEVTVESVPKVGTSFFIKLPNLSAQNSASQELLEMEQA